VAVWLFSLLVIPVASSIAYEPMGRGDFEDALREIYLTSRWDAGAAGDTVSAVAAYVKASTDEGVRIRFLSAAAPYHSLSEGYRPVRHRLVKLLGVAQRSEDSGRLVPEIRLALSDLALRNGEVRFSLRQLLSAAIWLQRPVPADLELRFREQVSRTYLAARMADFSLDFLEPLLEAADREDEGAAFHLRWLEIQALLKLGKLAEVKTLLAGIEGKSLDLLSDSELTTFWLARTWHALASGSPSMGVHYLEQARQVLPNSHTSMLRGEILFLEAWFLDHDKAAIRQIRDKLQLAREAFAEAAFPGRFSQLLIRAFAMAHDQQPSLSGSSDALVEALAAYASQGINLMALAEGLAAQALLNAGSESVMRTELIGLLMESRAFRDHFDRVIQEVTVDLLEENKRLFPIPDQSERTHSPYYLLLISLVLIVLVLVLILRIRTQLHLSQNLTEALEKARLSERRAEEASRSKSRFLANVSHEIKTPISGLVGMSSLLDEIVQDPELRNYVSTIRICSQNLHVLMNDLLNLGRMESGDFEIEEKPFSPREIAGYSLQVVKKSAQEKGLAVSSDLNESLPDEVISDGTRIGQVLTNLLINSIKFTDTGEARLQMAYERTLGSAGVLTCVVSDTGKGIPEEQLPRIFEPFSLDGYRSHESGSGLGLAICRKLVQLMGGTIEAKSELGKGTVFTVRIPVREKR